MAAAVFDARSKCTPARGLAPRMRSRDLRGGLTLVVCAEDRALLPRRRISHDRLEEEAVELGLGQRIRALVLDRVLRGEDEERPGQRARLALERPLLLLHRLEQ